MALTTLPCATALACDWQFIGGCLSYRPTRIFATIGAGLQRNVTFQLAKL
jgi:hypothetical protein